MRACAAPVHAENYKFRLDIEPWHPTERLNSFRDAAQFVHHGSGRCLLSVHFGLSRELLCSAGLEVVVPD
jgi:hypothetical protein